MTLHGIGNPHNCAGASGVDGLQVSTCPLTPAISGRLAYRHTLQAYNTFPFHRAPPELSPMTCFKTPPTLTVSPQLAILHKSRTLCPLWRLQHSKTRYLHLHQLFTQNQSSANQAHPSQAYLHYPTLQYKQHRHQVTVHPANPLLPGILTMLILHRLNWIQNKQTSVLCHQGAPVHTAAQAETCSCAWQHTTAACLTPSFRGWQTPQSGRWLCGRLRWPQPREVQLSST